MRTSWVLFFALVFTFCKCWKYVPLASTVAQWIGFVVIVSSLSYWLARYIWTVAFVDLVSGEGKAVLVTGCDSGFGYYLVKSLSRIGFFVFAGCLDAGSDGANDLSKFAKVKVLQMDISSEQQVNDALVAIKEGLGSRVLWAVVCNAGIRNEGLLEWVPMETLKRVIDVNIIGNCRVSKSFLPLLRKAKGRLVVITSSFGYVTMPMATPYSMTKHALVSMVDGLRRECYGKGVDIISVMPQAYKTNITAPSCAQRFTTEDLRQNCPDVADDFTQEEIDGWILSSKDYFDALNRDNLQEVADAMVLAVRETYPRTWYTTPLSLSTVALFPCTYLPDEVTDAIMAFARTRIASFSDLLKKNKKH
ncbi:D-beta-hydroxybutyrate dehydrogenase, mitochondrial [Rhipicephalus sanguineus]|uniref:D-beta-hydroxybutyrate dehydrogenase, mitochondrial n=1 Tax=Rhipicephalus sanguineus TaxID=34632 RepID=UPI0018936865|nr:D-beta-hydroxybutyrate dehydrogenase, mitochondrial [Rhipicephalus sanguineus]